MRSELRRLSTSALAIAVLGLGLALTASSRAADDSDTDKKKEKPALPITKKEEPAIKLPPVFDKSAPEGTADLKAMQKQVKEIFKKVMPATVCVQVGSGSGSGVVISEDGYVLTAGHVSGTPERDCTIVFPDGKRVKGKTLGYNKGIDSGLVKITDEGKWPHMSMGDSGKLKVGQWCMTLGHPGGYRPGRTPVLRLGRILTSTRHLIRTDCALVGGDSGGPLFDLMGKVIGIHSRISWDITANIHVPVNTFKETWDDLAAGKEWGGLFDFATRPRPTAILGVSFDGEAKDLKIIDIAKDGPADKAGLKAGDLILSIDGIKVKVRTDLLTYLSKKKPGNEVKVEIERDDETQSFTLKLGKRSKS